MNLCSRIKVPYEVMARPVGDETVILDIASGAYYGLDAVGARMWDLIGAGHSLAEIRDRLLQEYDVEGERLEHDLLKLVDELWSHGLVEVGEDAVREN